MDRDPDEIEYEKFCDECTFAPDLTSTKNRCRRRNYSSKEFIDISSYFLWLILLGVTSLIHARGFEKNVQRIQQGRTAREKTREMLKRGVPKPKNNKVGSTRKRLRSVDGDYRDAFTAG